MQREDSIYTDLPDNLNLPDETDYSLISECLNQAINEPAPTKREYFPRRIAELVMEKGSVAAVSDELQIPKSTIYYCLNKIKGRVYEIMNSND